MIIHVTRGLTKKRSYGSTGPFEDVSHLDLVVIDSTNVMVGPGIFPVQNIAFLIANVAIENVPNVSGIIRVTRWLKVAFEAVTINRVVVFGSGTIVDGIYKLRIRIRNYQPNPLLNVGISIAVRCRGVTDQNGVWYLAVQDSADININATIPAMAAADLRDAGQVTPV
ncbi:hypothetical protein KQX54_012383 [Cotesia glomerata]|uniref:Uncharacterized protein n=1 Tax=Cotesia glomerata TaxID=32391 RepID=A0AAV7I5P2_COTGL|nr:hypothetical protein KQX54_012383 [Cotesia glomerata]